jgi:hypothetical protein
MEGESLAAPRAVSDASGFPPQYVNERERKLTRPNARPVIKNQKQFMEILIDYEESTSIMAILLLETLLRSRRSLR